MRKLGAGYQKINSIWVILFGLIVLFLPVYFIVSKILSGTGGVFMYPYDDTFIHLQIADVLLKGNWGVNETEFASASSSILYTLILALGRMMTTSVMLPFIVNCLAGI